MFSLDKFENCACGKKHEFSSKVCIGEGVVAQLPQLLKERGVKKVFMLSDKNTFCAAGEKVKDILLESNISVCGFSFQADKLEPDEAAVGLAIMNYDSTCDAVVGVGSGVINDISKIVAAVSGKLYAVVATAPSMDGYASATSSMTRAGLKISLNSKCPEIIIGDTDILRFAPQKMLVAGLGDMLAKYVSICEWRISNIINGEYFCENIAATVRKALKKCVDNADGLLNRDKEAVEAVFYGLVLCGAAMKLAGVSRPASGVEHYLSHVWDMRGAAFGTNVEFHGIQCALGTLISVGLYEKLVKMQIDEAKALSYASTFNYEEWKSVLRSFLGKGAEDMIALEEKERKYDPELHKLRLQRIIQHWDDILKVIAEELPSSQTLLTMYKKLGLPVTLEEIGLDASVLPLTFKTTKDIRDKYVLSRLAWDIGVIDELV